MPKQYERYTINHAKPPLEGFNVYGWGTYPQSSVLAGQPMKVFLANFPTHELAAQAYPTATDSSVWIEPQVRLNHLPGEDDPVPGGAWPDDLTDNVGSEF